MPEGDIIFCVSEPAISATTRVIARYHRHYSRYEEEFDSVDEAFRFLAYGEDSGNLSSGDVIDGDTVYKRDTPEHWERLSSAWDALV